MQADAPILDLPSPDSFGAPTRAEMGRQRIRISELSRRTTIPRSTLSAQLNSDTLTVKTLLRVAAALGVDPASLLPSASDLAGHNVAKLQQTKGGWNKTNFPQVAAPKPEQLR